MVHCRDEIMEEKPYVGSKFFTYLVQGIYFNVQPRDKNVSYNPCLI